MLNVFSRKKNSKYHTQIFFIFFALIIILTAYMVKDYVGLIFSSFVFSVIIWPFYRSLKEAIPRPVWIATPIAVISSLFVLVVPMVVFIRSLLNQVVEAISLLQSSYGQTDWQGWIEQNQGFNFQIPLLDIQINQQLIIQSLSDLLIPLRNILVNSIWVVGNSSVIFFINFILVIFLVFFILPNLQKLKNFLISISPLSADATLQYFRRSHAMVMDTIKGTFVIGIVQGLVGGIFLAILGVPTPVFLAFLMMVLSILPIVGTGMVTVPIAIIYILSGHWIIGLLVFVWQMLVVNSVDNILRPLMVSKDANLHPALMLVAVLAGLQTFGFIGLIYGPLIMVILMTSIEVYRNEYRN